MTIFKELRYEDLDRLKPGRWLNDSLVFAGLKLVFPCSPALFKLIIPFRHWILVKYAKDDHPTQLVDTFFYKTLKYDFALLLNLL